MNINLKKVVNYNFHKHFVLKNNPAKNILDISNKLIGLHSARLITPFATLIPRLNKFSTFDLQNEITKKTALIKLRCMRKTLHLVSIPMAPIVHNATLNLRLSDCINFYKRNKYSELDIKTVSDLILNIVHTQGCSSFTILKSLKTNYEENFIKIVIKELWEKGTLCYVNNSQNWQKEYRLYDLTQRVYPNLDLNSIEISDAQEILILTHIDSFGPVTVKDISWWSGLPIGTIKKTMSKYKTDIVNVSIEGHNESFYMSLADYDKYVGFINSDKSWISLLAYEDPTLKGYYESRYRYIDKKYYSKLFNRIGEARASIVKNGKVIGIWTWNKETQQIEYKMFEKLTINDKKRLASEIKKTNECLKLVVDYSNI